MSFSEILGLGYVGVTTRSLDDWRDFGRDMIGFQVTPVAASQIGFRMDDAVQRLFVREGQQDGVEFYGWEVHDGEALARLAARIEAAGYPTSAMTAALRAHRHVAAGFVTRDPAGNVLEFFHGLTRTDEPFNPGRPIQGFRTGKLGMGHAVLNVASIEAMLPFYRDVLGFRLSDYSLRPFKAFFFHVNSRHHSLALIENEHPGMHHLMVELDGWDDVGQCYDIAQLHAGRVAATLGRHSNDHMTSFYLRTPSPFLIEYGWGGRDIDPATWEPVELAHGPSLWGHDRDWLSDELRDEARRMRLEAARVGVRAPLRIHANGSLAKGVWDEPGPPRGTPGARGYSS